MIYSILGDIAGSRFEFCPTKEKDIQLFNSSCAWTDDTISLYITVVICDYISKNQDFSEVEIRKIFIKEYRKMLEIYPMAGYGKSFYNWIKNDQLEINYSYGNGCLMRLSPLLFYFDIEKAQKIGHILTSISHNHEDSFKSVHDYIEIMYYLKNNQDIKKEQINSYLVNFMNSNGYSLLSVDDYSLIGGYHINAKDTLVRVISSFIESNDLASSFKNVLYIGSDTDTNCSLVGSLCECYYGIDKQYIKELYRYFDHKSEFLLKSITKNYLDYGIKEIDEINNFKFIDQTSLWDPLELPSDEEYYKFKKFTLLEYIKNLLFKF